MGFVNPFDPVSVIRPPKTSHFGFMHSELTHLPRNICTFRDCTHHAFSRVSYIVSICNNHSQKKDEVEIRKKNISVEILKRAVHKKFLAKNQKKSCIASAIFLRSALLTIRLVGDSQNTRITFPYTPLLERFPGSQYLFFTNFRLDLIFFADNYCKWQRFKAIARKLCM